MNRSYVSRDKFPQRSTQLFRSINGDLRWIEHYAMARQLRERSSSARESNVDEFRQGVTLSLS
jgi:hypothetical protein